MRIAKIVVLLLLAGAVSLAARQLFLRRHAIPNSANNEVLPWQRVNLISSIPRHRSGVYGLTEIALLDNGEAWAVGYDDMHPERVYHSRDRAQTWEPVDVPGNEWITFKAIRFADLRHGWAVGGDGLVIRTSDGGKSWEMQKSPTKADLETVHFVNSEVGYAGGTRALLDRITREVTGSLEILCTKTGGETWRQCYKENKPISVFQITSTSESTAFAITGGNRLLRTDDQGKSWQTIPLPVKYVFSIAFAPNGIGWLVGNQGAFLRSDDGGMTWQRPPSLNQDFASKDWEAVAFNTEGFGIAVGENSTLALTTDNGVTWELQNLQISDHLRSIQLRGSWAIVLGSQNAYTLRLE